MTAVMEVYSQKWGQCQCYKSTTQKMYFRFMDHIKFYKVATDDVKVLAAEPSFEECIEPVFLIYKDGKRVKTIIGIDGPGSLPDQPPTL